MSSVERARQQRQLQPSNKMPSVQDKDNLSQFAADDFSAYFNLDDNFFAQCSTMEDFSNSDYFLMPSTESNADNHGMNGLKLSDVEGSELRDHLSSGDDVSPSVSISSPAHDGTNLFQQYSTPNSSSAKTMPTLMPAPGVLSSGSLDQGNYQLINTINALYSRLTALEKVIYSGALPTAASAPTQLKRHEIEAVCVPLFFDTPEPTGYRLSQAVNQLHMAHPSLSSKIITSQVKLWFRKKREELGLKLHAAIKKRFPQLHTDFHGRNELRKAINAERIDWKTLLADMPGLLGTPSEGVVKLCREKLTSHLNRLDKI